VLGGRWVSRPADEEPVQHVFTYWRHIVGVIDHRDMISVVGQYFHARQDCGLFYDRHAGQEELPG
jgi:hypothetical protein